MPGTFHYPFFHKTIACDLELPELGAPICGSDTGPIRVRRLSGGVPSDSAIRWEEASPRSRFARVGRSGEYYLLRFNGMADILVDLDALSIEYSPAPDLPPATLRHLLIDQVLPATIGQSGRFVLHCSAILWQQRAILFAGESHWGKSTLAASFGADGGYYADDAVMLTPHDNGDLIAHSSYAGARLWPQSWEPLLGESPGASDYAHYSQKRRVNVAQGSGNNPVLVAAIFILNDPRAAPAREISIESPAGTDRMMAMLNGAFLFAPGEPGLMQTLMPEVGAVVRSGVPILSLSYPRSHSVLGDVRRHVLEATGYAQPHGNPQ